MTQVNQILIFVITLVAVSFLISFFVYSIRNRNSDGAIVFANWLGVNSIWLLIQILIPYLPINMVMIGLRFELLFICLVTPTYLLFILHFTSKKNWKKSWRKILIFVIPLLTFLLGISDKTIDFIWENLNIVSDNGFHFIQYNFGLGFVLLWSFSILVSAYSGYIVFNYEKFTNIIDPGQLRNFKAATIIPLVVSILAVITPLQPGVLRITSLGFGLAAIIMGFSVFYYHLFDLTPIIYQSLLGNLKDGIIVTDQNFRILQINKKAESLLNLDRMLSLGKILGTLLPVSSPWLKIFLSQKSELIIENKEGLETCYEIQYSTLSENPKRKNWLILIRDVTQYRNSKLAEQSVREMAEVRAMELDVLRKVAEQLNESVQFNDVMVKGLATVVSLVGARFGYVVLADEFGRPGLVGSYKLPAEIQKAFDAYPICPPCKSFERLMNGEYQEPVTFMPCRILFDVSISYPGLISIPLKLADRRMGFLHLGMAPDVIFTGDEISLLQTIGNQFSAAVERARMYENFEKLAMIDSLTGLYNRRQLFNLGQIEFSRACRYNHAISVIMLDIDWFKKVNDVYGHLTGDQVLQQIANRCRMVLRTSDVIGRFGGEEFVILLPQTNVQHAQNIANRIRLLVQDRPIMTDRGEISVTISLGISSMEGDCDSRLEWVVDQADQALLKAKDMGRNRVVIWEEDQVPVHKMTEEEDNPETFSKNN